MKGVDCSPREYERKESESGKEISKSKNRGSVTMLTTASQNTQIVLGQKGCDSKSHVEPLCLTEF